MNQVLPDDANNDDALLILIVSIVGLNKEHDVNDVFVIYDVLKQVRSMKLYESFHWYC
jgi:hypothetical protein